MTTIDIPPEEKPKGDPTLVASIERMKNLVMNDPIRQELVAKALERERALIHDSVSEIKNDVAKLPAVEQQSFSFLPTELTRVSPFFPMSKAEMGHRPLEKRVFNNAWGTMEIQGERLSIFDESILLAILRISSIKKAYTFSVTINEILTTMGTTAGKDTYNAVWAAIDRLIGTKINLVIATKKEKKKRLSNTILVGGVDNEKHHITITINPYFVEMYLDGFITSIDLDFRSSLKGDITKAMYRFYEGQSVNYEIHIDKLCAVINLNIDNTLPKSELRKRIKKSLTELIKHNYFNYGKINNKDHVVTKKTVTAVGKIAKRV